MSDPAARFIFAYRAMGNEVVVHVGTAELRLSDQEATVLEAVLQAVRQRAVTLPPAGAPCAR